MVMGTNEVWRKTYSLVLVVVMVVVAVTIPGVECDFKQVKQV